MIRYGIKPTLDNRKCGKRQYVVGEIEVKRSDSIRVRVNNKILYEIISKYRFSEYQIERNEKIRIQICCNLNNYIKIVSVLVQLFNGIGYWEFIKKIDKIGKRFKYSMNEVKMLSKLLMDKIKVPDIRELDDLRKNNELVSNMLFPRRAFNKYIVNKVRSGEINIKWKKKTRDPVSIYKSDIYSLFKKMGIGTGDTILLHSALKKIGEIDGGISKVIEVILERIGHKGTLIIPAFTYSWVGSLPFDINSTDNIYTGKLAKEALTNHGFIRTDHPTHSFAVTGKYANKLACININHGDLDSIWCQLIKLNTKVLLFGCGIGSNSILHYYEKKYNIEKVQTVAHSVVDGKIIERVIEASVDGTVLDKINRIYRNLLYTKTALNNRFVYCMETNKMKRIIMRGRK